MSMPSFRQGAAALALALTPMLAGAVAVSRYEESGDAGGMPTPQAITGGPYNGIQGTLGGNDEVDAFLFWFGGGDFVASAGWDDTTTGDLFLELFGNGCLASCASISTGTNSLTATGLAPGNYVFEVSTSLAADPPFHIDLFDLNPLPIVIAPPQRLPSPSTLALLGAALVAAAWVARRRGG